MQLGIGTDCDVWCIAIHQGNSISHACHNNPYINLAWGCSVLQFMHGVLNWNALDTMMCIVWWCIAIFLLMEELQSSMLAMTKLGGNAPSTTKTHLCTWLLWLKATPNAVFRWSTYILLEFDIYKTQPLYLVALIKGKKMQFSDALYSQSVQCNCIL